MYRPFSIFSTVCLFIYLTACIPVNYSDSKKILIKNQPDYSKKETVFKKLDQEKYQEVKKLENSDILLSGEIEIILPKIKNKLITKQLINAFELSIYKKQASNISLNINMYYDLDELDRLLFLKAKPGKIFVGTFKPDATKIVKKYCEKGILFFSFSSYKKYANECVYLINFFPEDDLIALFNYFPKDSKVALLYPDNFYGNNINRIIDSVATKSQSLIINKISYKEDLTNARDAIKKLGKYQFRKLELERQKKLLEKKNDEHSQRTLKKIQKFETTGNVDFTHLLLPDYSIRLLEIAPLLPFYDVDPNKVQFVGTGVWDDEVFFEEPSLQGAIFPGIEKKKRIKFFGDYEYIYKEKAARISSIPYDLVGLLSYMIEKKIFVDNLTSFFNNEKIKFDGIDGTFYFKENSIFRELDILKIHSGKAIKLD